MSQDQFGVLDRRIFLKTALVSGAALTAGLPARSLLAAGKAPDTIRVGFFLETKPTMIAKGEGWFDKFAGGKCAWSEAGSGAEINTAMAVWISAPEPASLQAHLPPANLSNQPSPLAIIVGFVSRKNPTRIVSGALPAASKERAGRPAVRAAPLTRAVFRKMRLSNTPN